MSTQNCSPENGGVLSRRDFLRHSVVALAWMSLSSFSRGVGKALAAPRESEPDFSPPDNFDGSSVLSPVNHQAAKSNAGILQTGLDQIEVDGKMYRPVVGVEAMKELILSLALIYQGQEAQNEAGLWLEESILEINVFAPGALSVVFGGFGRPNSDGDARISINAEVLKELYFPGSSRHPVIMLSEAVGDLSPKTTLPHEIQHFVGWLEHPEDYGGWKAAVTNLSQCLIIPAQIMVACGITYSNFGKKIHRDRRLGRVATTAAIAYATGWVFDKAVNLTVDVHAKEKYDDGAIGKLLDEYPQIAALNLQALSLEPV